MRLQEVKNPQLVFSPDAHRGHRLGARTMQPVRAWCGEISVPHGHFGATCVHLVLTVWIRLRASRALLDSCGWRVCPPERSSPASCEFISVSESLRSTAVPSLAASFASLSAVSFPLMPVCECSYIRNTSESFSIS